jgi:hypothetical protein
MSLTSWSPYALSSARPRSSNLARPVVVLFHPRTSVAPCIGRVVKLTSSRSISWRFTAKLHYVGVEPTETPTSSIFERPTESRIRNAIPLCRDCHRKATFPGL